MAQLTALQLIAKACYRSNVTSAPAALVGVSTPSTLQLLELFYETGEDLLQSRWWPQLKKQFQVTLKAGQRQYGLPQDYYSYLPATMWDQQNRWEMRGPLGDGAWNYRTYGYVTIENRKAFRIFGPDSNPNTTDTGGQFWVDPVPGATSDGQPITFEYLSKSWLTPPYWAPNTAITLNSYRTSSGNIYKCTTAGTTYVTAYAPPNMAYGLGHEGGVWWQFVTRAAWVLSTAYSQGDYVTNSGNNYICTTGGTSASSGGPTTTASSITDGTVTWKYLSVSAWVTETSYAVGTYVTNGSNLYLCATPRTFSSFSGISGKLGPAWTLTTIPDGTVTWTYQPQSYETLTTDSDLCLFDDELMILGCRWRFMQARGFEYQDLMAEYNIKKDRAVSRWNPGDVLSLGGGSFTRSINLPEGNFG